eukprot:353899-Chlamydomonas_euryale.AAC.1
MGTGPRPPFSATFGWSGWLPGQPDERPEPAEIQAIRVRSSAGRQSSQHSRPPELVAFQAARARSSAGRQSSQ